MTITYTIAGRVKGADDRGDDESRYPRAAAILNNDEAELGTLGRT